MPTEAKKGQSGKKASPSQERRRRVIMQGEDPPQDLAPVPAQVGPKDGRPNPKAMQHALGKDPFPPCGKPVFMKPKAVWSDDPPPPKDLVVVSHRQPTPVKMDPAEAAARMPPPPVPSPQKRIADATATAAAIKAKPKVPRLSIPPPASPRTSPKQRADDIAARRKAAESETISSSGEESSRSSKARFRVPVETGINMWHKGQFPRGDC